MNFFGDSKEEAANTEDSYNFKTNSPVVQSPFLALNPDYLSGADEYILPEDAAPVRTRVQMMFATIGSVTVLGAGIGGFGSLRYSGLQFLTGKSKRMQLTSSLIKNGGQMAQKFGTIGVLYCACSIICEKSRGVEDDLNTLVGGVTAGGIYMLPGVFGEKKEIPKDAKLQFVRRLPPVGRIFFGASVGLALSSLICLYRLQGSNIVRDITKRT